MKRSEINATIKKMEALLDECRFKLPPYLYFTPEEWADKNHEYDEIRECELGWDVTDYGEGKFDTLGLALITIRNGNIHNPKYPKTYAEKIMMCDSGQVSPMHYHENKREDIINRGGNDVVQVLQLVINLMGIGADLRSDLHLGLGKIRGDKGMGGFVAKGMGGHGDIAVLQHPDILLFQSDGTAQ